MGIFEALELDSDNQRAKELRTASIKASRHAERTFGEFLAGGDRETRLSYVEGSVRELTERYAEYEGVDHGMLHAVVMQHLAEFGLPVEESKPKRINVETPIGAESENTKYKPEETPLDITRTDILDHDAVEEPEATRVDMAAEGVTVSSKVAVAPLDDPTVEGGIFALERTPGVGPHNRDEMMRALVAQGLSPEQAEAAWELFAEHGHKPYDPSRGEFDDFSEDLGRSFGL
jgi:hypothetical protein